jgi:hypothetical protein
VINEGFGSEKKVHVVQDNTVYILQSDLATGSDAIGSFKSVEHDVVYEDRPQVVLKLPAGSQADQVDVIHLGGTNLEDLHRRPHAGSDRSCHYAPFDSLQCLTSYAWM